MRLIISTPNRETTCKGEQVHTPFHIKEFTLGEIFALLKNFKDEKVFAQKMSYYRRIYKKLRLFVRYAKKNLRNAISSRIEKRWPMAAGPWFCRVLLYEFKYKFTVMEYREKNKYIKPTIFVIVCVKK